MPSKYALFSVAALLSIMAAVVSSRAEVAAGQPAPLFAANDSRGGQQRLADFKGKTVVLEWTNHECPYTIKHYASANMQKLQGEATAQGVVWLTVVSSAPGQQGHVDAAQAERLSAERGAKPTAVLLDPGGDLGRLYAAKSTPHMFVIDQHGNLAYAGAIDDRPTADINDVAGARSYVREALAAIAAGTRPSPSATRPYGCSVKYAPQ